MTDAAPPISMKRRVITTAILIILVWMGARFAFKALKEMREGSARTGGGSLPPMVRAELASRRDYRETLTGFGRARALNRVEVVAEVAGVVAEVSPLLEAGTAIQHAQEGGSDGGTATETLPVVVRIDDRDLADRLGRAEADAEAAAADVARLLTLERTIAERLAVAQEELETSEREMRRIAGLVPKTYSRSQLDTQRLQVTLRRRQQLLLASSAEENVSALTAARARVKARARDVDLARRELERALIRPPFPGRIEARHVNVGARVRVGDPLFTLIDLSRLEVPVALPAGRYAEVQVGSRAVLRLPESDAPLWEGKVARVSPRLNAQERTFFAYVILAGTAVANPAAPGSHLLAAIDGRLHANVVAVPRQAFLGQRVFVAKPIEGKDEAVVEERRPVISRTLAGVALVLSGIEDGERFLVTNLESVADGSRVRLAPDLDSGDPAPQDPPAGTGDSK